MKIVKILIKIIVVAALLTAAIFGAMFLTEYLDTESEDGAAVTVVIPEGASGKAMASILKDNGLLRFKTTFVLRLRGSEYAGRLRSGSFELHKGMCIDDMIKALATGGDKKGTVDVTVPEGYSIEQIANIFESKGLFPAADFLAEAENGVFDYDVLNSIPNDDNIKYRLQGFLFPSTYNFYVDATPHDVIDTMIGEFVKKYDGLTNNSGRSAFEIVTIASLVEREAKVDAERPLIAGVIENRLAIDMPLQIDAAVIYAVTDGMYDLDRVLYKHLEIDSPYNIYKNYGLPAGPICSPGEKSLDAAMNPASHDYLYYHTDEEKGDGSHIFTSNFSDHNATMN